MSNSSLVDCTVLSPNHSGKRTQKLTRITPHIVVGQLNAENIGYCFTDKAREASCNYGIGTEGRVCLIVDEDKRSWCSSSWDNDQRAVTIECASDKTYPYALNNVVYNKLIDLCVDICKRNGKTKLLWFADKNKTLTYAPADNEMILTVHRWFANTECCGDWLYTRLGDVANKVTKRLTTEQQKPDILYRVQVGAFSVKANAENMLKKLKDAGFNGFIVTVENAPAPAPAPAPKKTVDELAREVIQGKWGNGTERKNRLTQAGYNYSEVQARVDALLTK